MAEAKNKEKEIKEAIPEGERLVEVELFRDNKDYKDDVFVVVNGKSVSIKRGERVKIKEKFARVLTNSLKQDISTAEMCSERQDSFFREARERNL